MGCKKRGGFHNGQVKGEEGEKTKDYPARRKLQEIFRLPWTEINASADLSKAADFRELSRD
jgi:hypothetical protein